MYLFAKLIKYMPLLKKNNNKMLLWVKKYGTNKWKNITCYWTGKSNILNTPIILKIGLYIQFNPMKYSTYFLLVEIDKPVLKFM